MNPISILLLAASALVSTTVAQNCTASPTLLPDTIAAPFAIEVQNSSYPAIHGRRMNFWKAGGGDNHLYLSPAGDAISNSTLVAGVLTNTEPTFGDVTIRAVINGEYTPTDNTTKIFMTQRGDPRAYLKATQGCNQTSGVSQTEFSLVNGGDVCVRPASGDRWEFRYSGVGNTVANVKGCVNVVLAPVFSS